MIFCGKRDIPLVQVVIIYSTISCTTKFGVIQRENKIMSVVVLLVLYAIAINSLMKGILVLWSVSLVAHRGVVFVVSLLAA